MNLPSNAAAAERVLWTPPLPHSKRIYPRCQKSTLATASRRIFAATVKGSEKRKAEIFFAVREVIRAYVGVNKSGMARERSFGEGFLGVMLGAKDCVGLAVFEGIGVYCGRLKVFCRVEFKD